MINFSEVSLRSFYFYLYSILKEPLYKHSFIHKLEPDTVLSITHKLINENIINKDFLLILSNLSLEDIIALKLEQTSDTLHGKLFGIPIWTTMIHIVRDALLKYALSVSYNLTQAKAHMGIKSLTSLKYYIMKYRIYKYFNMDEYEKKYWDMFKEKNKDIIERLEKYNNIPVDGHPTHTEQVTVPINKTVKLRKKI